MRLDELFHLNHFVLRQLPVKLCSIVSDLQDERLSGTPRLLLKLLLLSFAFRAGEAASILYAHLDLALDEFWQDVLHLVLKAVTDEGVGHL